jgi:RNA polymerase sigma-70 factor (ECF subfamily)
MTQERLDLEAFGQLARDLRPRLHRYAARMVGSALDGEDVVQEALAKAAEALPTIAHIEKLEGWLFRIAHNCALDALRRRKRQEAMRSEAEVDSFADASAAADSRVAAASSLAAFLRLPATQRACVALIDVLGHSVVETTEILGVSLAAAKAALHRGRARLRNLAQAPDAPIPALAATERERLRAYADRFNARDFDALRDLLADDVRLDLVNRRRLAGRKDVSVYFSRYAEGSDWRLAPGVAEGRPVLLVSDPADPSEATVYVVTLEWAAGRIKAIRDFRYAAYAMECMASERL